ncbi:MAG TPA: NADH-quinone oxidoreductase subunit J, partial [Terriglobales bacterium]|nr:NADH-quinone oxidoreductase subunit J [Terriglobales bacterium]
MLLATSLLQQTAAPAAGQPVATTFFFYLLAGIALVTGVAVIVQKNPVHSAISLVFTLLSLAGLYLMLYAPFVAGVQIILYVGGIMVLFLFVIMLVNLDEAAKQRQFNRQWLVALIATALVGAQIGWFVWKGKDAFRIADVAIPESGASAIGNTEKIAEVLFTDYLLPFEIASILLLVAVVG